MMEQNSSTVHSDESKTPRLLGDDAMPLYATVMPSSTRKARWVIQHSTDLQISSYSSSLVENALFRSPLDIVPIFLLFSSSGRAFWLHNELATLLSSVYHCEAIERTCQLFPRHSFGFNFQANKRKRNKFLCSLGKEGKSRRGWNCKKAS